MAGLEHVQADIQTKRQRQIHAYVGEPSLTATLLALVFFACGATAASAHVTSKRAHHRAGLALAAHAVVLRPGAGYGTAGSPAVRDLQRLLGKAGYRTGRLDGRYGPRTTLAVMRYQANAGLRVDGVAGPQTLGVLTGKGVVLRPGAGYASRGSPAVRDLQRLLVRAGYPPGPIDGLYGPRTERAVRRYQAHRRLPVGGIVGSRMFADLRLKSVSKHVRLKSQSKHAARRWSPRAPAKPVAGRAAPTLTTPAPTATTPRATTPATPAPKASAPTRARHGGHSMLIAWIWLLALLSVGLGVGVVRWVRRRPGDGWQMADDLGRAATDVLAVLGRNAARLAARLGQTAAQAGRYAADRLRTRLGATAPQVWQQARRVVASAWHLIRRRAADLWRRTASRAADLWRRTASRAADLWRRTASLAAGLRYRASSLAARLGRAAAGVRQRTARHGRRRSVGLRVTPQRRAVPTPTGAESAGTKSVSAVAPREVKSDAGNGGPGGINTAPVDINAAFNLGVLLEERRDLSGAEAAYRRADERGHAAAASNLGVLLEGQGDRTGADAAYRRADQRGDANGSFNLGVLLEDAEDLAGAEAAYRRADERGHAAAASNLGVLLEGQGDRTGAEATYRRADQRGDANGSFNLGVLLEEAGDLTGAESAYRRAEKSADTRVAPLARTARLELVAGIPVCGVARKGRDDDRP